MARRPSITGVATKMHTKTDQLTSRGIFPSNVNSLRARGQARLAIKNAFAPTARHDAPSAPTSTRDPIDDFFLPASAGLPPLLSPDATDASNPYKDTGWRSNAGRQSVVKGLSHCTSRKAQSPSDASMFHPTKALTIVADTPPSRATGGCSSPPTWLSAQPPKKHNTPSMRRARSRSGWTQRSQSVRSRSRTYHASMQSRSGRKSMRGDASGHVINRQELEMRRDEHMSRYRQTILDAMNPASLLVRIGLPVNGSSPASNEPSPRSTKFAPAADNGVMTVKSAVGPSVSGAASQRAERSVATGAHPPGAAVATSDDPVALVKMVDAAREALAHATTTFREQEEAAANGSRVDVQKHASQDNPVYQKMRNLRKMFAMGAGPSSERTAALLAMLKETVETVHAQLAVGEPRRRGRRTHALNRSKTMSFRPRDSSCRHGPLESMSTDAGRTGNGGGSWGMGIGVLPPAGRAPFRAAVTLSDSLRGTPASRGLSTVSDEEKEALATRRAKAISALDRALDGRRISVRPSGMDASEELSEDETEEDREGDEGEDAFEGEGMEVMPSAMDQLRHAGLAFKEPDAATATDAVAAAGSGKRLAKELRALLGPLNALSEKDYANSPVPPLAPPPPEVAKKPTACMQWRVQRVWATLDLQPLQRLEMMLRFVDWGFGGRMEESVDAWEGAAAAVKARQGLLAEITAINEEANKDDPNVTKVKTCVSRSRALLIITEHVRDAARVLKDVTGEDLTLSGSPYPPPGALGKAALSEFCTRMLRKVSESS